MSSHVMSGDVFNNPLAKIDPGAMLLKKALYRPDKPAPGPDNTQVNFQVQGQPMMQNHMQNQMQNRFQHQNAQQQPMMPMHQGLLAMRQRGR